MSRRLPVYLLLDVSGSMVGEPIAAVANGVQTMISALHADPNAMDCACISIITFGNNAQQLIPLTDISRFTLPQLTTGGLTCLGAALSFVARCAEQETTSGTPEAPGDWLPLVFIMTDGEITDDLAAGIDDFRKRDWGVVVACGAGTGANTFELAKITPSVIKLDTTDASSFQAYFMWVSDSIATTSRSVTTQNCEITTLVNLPEPPPVISIV